MTELPLGLKLIDLKLFHDDRGYFTEWYQQERFTQYGIPPRFVQDNISRSKPGVIRGLHYQINGQGKLVGAVRGRIWDVAVDLRENSHTYGKWHGVELSDVNGKLFWIPPGFAHGFCVLGNEDATVMYKIDVPYTPSAEKGIRYNDPDLKIAWPVQVRATVVSTKDQVLPTFAEYRAKPDFHL